MGQRLEINQDQLQRFKELCRRHGLPLTIQRRAILEAVLRRDDHPTVDQIHEEVEARTPGVSRTTVYRVLDMLVRIGIITRACHPGAAARFDRNTEPHHHLVCLHCDKVIDLEDERLSAVPLPDIRHLGFQITDLRVQLRGICADCRKETPSFLSNPTLPGNCQALIPKKNPAQSQAKKKSRKKT